MTMDDIAAVAAMEADNSQTPWDETSLFTYFMRDDTILLVAEEYCPECAKDACPADTGSDSAWVICGFCGVILMPPESDVLDITVDLASRNRGIGTELLDEIIKKAWDEKKVDTVYLEVRTGNAPARHVYEKLGFRQTGMRKNYYTDPVEDAILMTYHRALTAEPDME
ncbi:MAG: ribosomal protein S18-alanine N-acetyltransferase [Eubacteriales bacterium]|nr:ribosomal protein S18-alanine N-acetyltransferase [Eubacteriales bacterium]